VTHVLQYYIIVCKLWQFLTLVYIFSELTNDCVVQAIDLSQDQLSLFGLGVENGPENITASFNWNTNYSSTFVVSGCSL